MSTTRFSTISTALLLAVAGVAGCLATPASAGSPPTLVAPGSTTGPVTAGALCPSFHWTAAPGADTVELLVYELADLEGGDPAAAPVLAVELPGGATSWAPSIEQCLRPDGAWAWLVRGHDESGPGPWSEARLFRTPEGPSEDELARAVELVSRYLGESAEPRIADSPDDARIERGGKRASSSVLTAAPAEITTGTAAIRGALPQTRGTTFGVEGVSRSPEGAGIHAYNEHALGLAALLEGHVEITGSLLCDGCVDTDDIASNTIDGSDIANRSIEGVDIQIGAITANEVAVGALTGTSIQDDSITRFDIVDGTLTGVDIADGSITGLDIQDGSITSLDIQNGSISGADLLPFSGTTSTGLSGAGFTVGNIGDGGAISATSQYASDQAYVPAIRGRHTHASGAGIGVQGLTDSSQAGGAGVWGEATSDTGPVYGVRGKAKSPDGYGGYFENREGAGLFAEGKAGWAHDAPPDLILSGMPGSGPDPGQDRDSSVIRAPGPMQVDVFRDSEWSYPLFELSAMTHLGQRFPELQLSNGGNLWINGSLTQSSDRDAKQDVVPVAPREILARLEALPVSTWQYLDDPDVTHMGPMAQDFHAAFGLGATPTGINAIDADGVSLAAIQGLAALVREQETRIRELERSLAARSELPEVSPRR